MESQRNCFPPLVRRFLLSHRVRLHYRRQKCRISAALFCGLSLIGILAAGCTPVSPKGEGSVLILAVPNFRADDLGCGSSSGSITPQLDLICNEGVRFTHAYTTSVLSVPALASMLTGLYPVEHGIHRNDASKYSSDVKSVPELARAAGIDTIFVSGGVPALKKTGISRGFAAFDDSVRVGGSFYRSADETAHKFMSTLENRADGNSFFGVVYFADSSFPEIIGPKISQSEKRESSYGGKLQEIDEAVGWMRAEFKKQGIWDRLTVVIVGLQGDEKGEHEGLSKGLNLYDEVVRIPLLVKPTRKPIDQGPSWKVDVPVTLADIGATLLRYVGAGESKKSPLSVADLTPALEGHALNIAQRPLFCESDLPAWRQWGSRIVAVRRGEWVYFPSPEEKLFDTYTDRLEQRNLYTLDFPAFRSMDNLWHTFAGTFREKGSLSRFMPVSVSEKLKAARTVFSKTTQAREKLAALSDMEIRRPDDWQIVQWHVQEILETQNWNAFKDLLNKNHPVTPAQAAEYRLWWTFFKIKSHAKMKDEDLKSDPSLNCLYLALALKRFSPTELDYYQNRQACKDHEIQAWVNSFVNFKNKKMKEATSYFDVARNLAEKRAEQTDFAKQFWIDGAVWDFPKELPAGPSVFEMFALLVNNPEFLDFVRKKQFP